MGDEQLIFQPSKHYSNDFVLFNENAKLHDTISLSVLPNTDDSVCDVHEVTTNPDADVDADGTQSVEVDQVGCYDGDASASGRSDDSSSGHGLRAEHRPKRLDFGPEIEVDTEADTAKSVLVFVNEQAAACSLLPNDEYEQRPRVNRLSRKAPLADEDEAEDFGTMILSAAGMGTGTGTGGNRHNARRLAMQVSLPASQLLSTNSSMFTRPSSAPIGFGGLGFGGAAVAGTGAGNGAGSAMQDPFFQIRQRLIEPRRNEAWVRVHKGLNKIMGFMFSHIGLFLVVVIYAMLGGIVFPPMEKDTEIARRQELETKTKNMSDSLLHIIYNVSLNLLSSTEYHVDDQLIRMCEEIRLHEIQKNSGPWSQSQAQRPTRSARAIRWKRSNFPRDRAYDTYVKFAKLWRRNHHSRLKMQIEEHISKFKRDVYIATMNGWDGETINKQTQWTFAGSTLYSITVITTIGYGHLVPRTLLGRVVTILYALVGIPLTLLCVASMGSLFASMFRETYMYFYVRWSAPRVKVRRNNDEAVTAKMSRYQQLKRRLMRWRAGEHQQVLANCLYTSAMACGNIGAHKLAKFDDQCSTLQAIKRDSQKLLLRQQVRVPVYITLLGIVFYMLLGASMFSIWEGWSFFEAFYFSFITLSTIGFGDYVPGATMEQQKEDSQGKLVLCCLYLIFGLGMMSMTIQLMQDSVKESFIKVAQKLGIMARKDNSITSQTKEKNPIPQYQ